MHGEHFIHRQIFPARRINQLGDVLRHEERAVGHLLQEVGTVKQLMLREIDHDHAFSAFAPDGIEFHPVGAAAQNGFIRDKA